MFIKLLIIAIVLLSIAFIGMGITILVKKGGKFPQISIGKNKEMHKKGISCVKHEELKCHNKRKGNDSCPSCC